MKNILNIPVFGTLLLALCFGVFSAPQDVLAAPAAHAPAWGYYAQASGQTKKANLYDHNYDYSYDHDYQYDRNDSRRFSDFHSWIREYMQQWFRMRLGQYQSYTTSTTRVLTGTVTGIAEDRGTLHAQAYLSSSVDEAEVWFEYGTTAGSLDDESAHTTITQSGAVTRTVTGLDTHTKYYYRAVLEDGQGDTYYGTVRSFTTGTTNTAYDEPTLTTRTAADIGDDQADLRGTVNMRDYDNGKVFFVYGTDQSQVADVAGDYESYNDIDEDGIKLQKFVADSDLDTSSSYTERVTGLDSDTRYYYAIGVEYEDGSDTVLKTGSIQNFRTDA